MPSYFMEIEYTRADGSTFHALGSDVMVWVDGRFGTARATDTIIETARLIASHGHEKVTLVGVRKHRDYSDAVYPLPDGSRDVVITPMTDTERAEFWKKTVTGSNHL